MFLTNGILELFGAFLCLMILIGSSDPGRIRSRDSLVSRVILYCTVGMLACDGAAICWLLGTDLDWLGVLLTGVSILLFFAIYYAYSYYVLVALKLQKAFWVRPYLAITLSLCLLGALYCCVDCFTLLFFDIHSARVTNPLLYRLSSLPILLTVLMQTGILLAYRERISRSQAVCLIVTPLLPLSVTILGQPIQGLSLQRMLILAALLYIHIRFNTVKDRELERELRGARLQLTLGRVQPHYVYNVLTSIYYLCEQDPHRAQEALGVFANYLRETLHSLDQQEPVPFSWELTLIENYLRLEKLRFGERIEVRYDIQERDFMIPPFTVQPLVENAVKHGLKGRQKIRIDLESRRTERGCEVIVRDDGAGVGKEGLQTEGSTGLRSIRDLLALQNSGELQWESRPGGGTVARVQFKPHRPHP